MNALVFLYKHVLGQPLNGEINADRARRKARIPIVLTREETARVIARLSGVHQLIISFCTARACASRSASDSGSRTWIWR